MEVMSLGLWGNSGMHNCRQRPADMLTDLHRACLGMLTRMPLPVTRLPGTALTSMKTNGTPGNSSLKSFCSFGFK